MTPPPMSAGFEIGAGTPALLTWKVSGADTWKVWHGEGFVQLEPPNYAGFMIGWSEGVTASGATRRRHSLPRTERSAGEVGCQSPKPHSLSAF